MKAVVCTAYGSPEVLRLQEVEKPVPKDDEVLIKVFAATVNIGDCRVRSWTVPLLFWIPYRLTVGLTKPKHAIFGAVPAGEVVAVGKDVTRFTVGDRVYGMDIDGRGAHAQYACWSEDRALAIMPSNLTYEEAAAVPHGALTALFFLKEKANVQSGQKVLINGASGAVGTFAVQLAKYLGAEVTGVCSTANLDLVRSLGADRVIDYTKEDFTTGGETYDIIHDAVAKSSFWRCRDSLAPEGIYLAPDPSTTTFLSVLWTSLVGSKKAMWGVGPERGRDLDTLTGLIEEGVLKPVIDRVYPLEQVPEAHSYVEKGHAKGNVVIAVAHDDSA
jgi:NADPH:quinone reductase-like Zn-dependent oxidoreductase